MNLNLIWRWFYSWHPPSNLESKVRTRSNLVVPPQQIIGVWPAQSGSASTPNSSDAKMINRFLCENGICKTWKIGKKVPDECQNESCEFQFSRQRVRQSQIALRRRGRRRDHGRWDAGWPRLLGVSPPDRFSRSCSSKALSGPVPGAPPELRLWSDHESCLDFSGGSMLWSRYNCEALLSGRTCVQRKYRLWLRCLGLQWPKHASSNLSGALE